LIRVGTAGWSLPREWQGRFPGAGSHLERYAAVFDAAEINSTFHRPHRASTYARWAASVPRNFRFSMKLPKAITHEARLRGVRRLLRDFFAEVDPLRSRIGCVLVQLPPSLALEPRVARGFFSALRQAYDGPVAIEPRHPTWFTTQAGRMLAEERVARVAADPAKAVGGDEPGGFLGLAYYRLHGSPRVYYSSYPEPFLDALALRLRTLRRAGVACWCIFDNTTLGAATGNALGLASRLAKPRRGNQSTVAGSLR
jgi:uncharacterized protein YecE (DUF72 family)